MTAVYSPSTSSTAAGSGNFFIGKSRQFTTRRPWRELLGSTTSYSVPYGYTEFRSRLNCNLNHYRVNYAMIVLSIIFLSLLYHPISMIVFVIVFVLWLMLYFSRDEAIVVLNFAVDDRAVLIGLGIVTVVALALTRVWLNVLVSMLIAVAVVVAHASVRAAEDVYLGEDEYGDDDGALLSVVEA